MAANPHERINPVKRDVNQKRTDTPCLFTIHTNHVSLSE